MQRYSFFLRSLTCARKKGGADPFSLGVIAPFMLAPTSGARFLGGLGFPRGASSSRPSRDSRKASPTAQPSNV